MSKLMSDIFLSEMIKDKVNSIHSSLNLKSLANLTPLDFMLVPHRYTDEKVKKLDSVLKEKIKLELLTVNPIFKQFKVYDMVECQYMLFRSNLVAIDDVNKILHVNRPSLEELTKASWHCTYPMQSFWFKQMVITYGYEQEYHGIQAYTSPVDNATRLIFGRNFDKDSIGHTKFCEDLALELNEQSDFKVTPTYVNTVLFIKGKYL